MRKIKFAFFLLVFFLFSSFSVSAKEESSVISPTPSIKQTIEYDLPYPGILPDNPLYKLKALRDKAIGFLISDPKKKAEFNLLQADKRLNAGVYLFNKGKNIFQAEATISKAENYFFEAISEIRKANDRGINTDELTGKLLDASKKHQEIIASLEEKPKNNIREKFAFQRKRAEGFEKRVNQLLSEEIE